ncbi:MAG: hypothetical protein H7222_00025 [Methylotenera sp.]|nr:hypothetical protein [Oligoflexia bacterium]
MIKLKENYDWVVAGDHPAALLSAALVAKLGLSVLIVDSKERPLRALLSMHSHEKPPQKSSQKSPEKAPSVYSDRVTSRLNEEPNFYLTLRSGLLNDSLKSLGITDAELAYQLKSGHLPQILTPEHRVQIKETSEALDHEFNREFGQKSELILGLLEAVRESSVEVLEYWRTFPERFTFALTAEAPESEERQRWPLKKKPKHLRKAQSFNQLCRQLLKQKFASKSSVRFWFKNGFGDGSTLKSKKFSGEKNASGELNVLLEGLFAGLFFPLTRSQAASRSRQLQGWTVFQSLHAVILAQSGSALVGGPGQLKKMLLDAAARFGAQVISEAACVGLVSTAGRLTHVKIEGFETPVSTRGFLSGTSLSEVKSEISFDQRRFWDRLKSPLTPVGWSFQIGIRVRSISLPPGMTSRMIWQQPDSPSLDLELISDPGNPDEMLLMLRTVVPYASQSLDPEFQRVTAARMFQKLRELLPFLESAVIGIEPEFRTEVHQSSSFQQSEPCHRWKDIAEIPAHLLIFGGKGVGCRTGIEGLFISSYESFPSLGSFGGFLAAIEASAWIAHRCGLPGPFAAAATMVAKSEHS